MIIRISSGEFQPLTGDCISSYADPVSSYYRQCFVPPPVLSRGYIGKIQSGRRNFIVNESKEDTDGRKTGSELISGVDQSIKFHQFFDETDSCIKTLN